MAMPKMVIARVNLEAFPGPEADVLIKGQICYTFRYVPRTTKGSTGEMLWCICEEKLNRGHRKNRAEFIKARLMARREIGALEYMTNLDRYTHEVNAIFRIAEERKMKVSDAMTIYQERRARLGSRVSEFELAALWAGIGHRGAERARNLAAHMAKKRATAEERARQGNLFGARG
jgi:hypothetical protein